jgi:hypothetical protein
MYHTRYHMVQLCQTYQPRKSNLGTGTGTIRERFEVDSHLSTSRCSYRSARLYFDSLDSREKICELSWWKSVSNYFSMKSNLSRSSAPLYLLRNLECQRSDMPPCSDTADTADLRLSAAAAAAVGRGCRTRMLNLVAVVVEFFHIELNWCLFIRSSHH